MQPGRGGAHLEAMPARRGLEAFFEPDAVAVIGASGTPGKAGYQQLVNLQRGFAGRVYPVNPKRGHILGLDCFPSVTAIPGRVDLAIVLLPAAKVPDAVRECVASGVAAVLIASGGFAETGPAGAALQHACVAAVRGGSTRLWGPNCNGLVNTAHNLLASFVDLPEVRPGPVAIIAQSGIYAAAFLNQLMEREGFGVSKVATLGNAADVEASEILAYLAHDPATQVVALHLEGVRDGTRLVEVCRCVVRDKPVVALVAGETAAGAQASLSHTANLAADGRLVRSALRQAGIAEAGDFIELADLAEGLAVLGRSRPAERVAVLTTTGGAGVVAADLLARAGLRLATIAPQTRVLLGRYDPAAESASNPLDIWPPMQRHGTDTAVRELTDLVLADPGVDAALFVMGAFSGGGTDFRPELLGPILQRRGKPISAWLYGPERYLAEWRGSFRDIGVPVFRDIRTAVALLAGSNRLATAARIDTVPQPGFDPAAIRSRIARFSARRLNEPEAYEVLRACGIASAVHRVVHSESEAAEAACALGGRVVLKIVSREIAHKSARHGVITDLYGDQDVRGAFRQLRGAAATDGVLVQRYLPGGREVIIGLVNKGSFGHAVMVGLGGAFVEAIGSVAFGVPPLRTADIDRLIADSGVEAVLDGIDPAPLRNVITAVSALSEAAVGIDELEINPLLLFGSGEAVAVDAVVTLRT